MATRIKTGYPGVFYREHPTRRFGRHADKYYIIRYRNGKRQADEGVGWSTDGWTAESVSSLLGEIKRNITTGEGPQSLREKRAASSLQREQDEAEALRLHLEDAPSRLTFADLATRYLAHSKLNKATWRDDDGQLRNHLLPFFGPRLLVEITQQTVENFKATLLATSPQRGDNQSGTLSASSVTQALGLVRRMFNYALDAPLYEDNPAIRLFTGDNPARLTRRRGRGGVQLPRLRNRRMRVLTQTEVNILLDDICETNLDLFDITLLALDTGIRRGEICTLTTQAIVSDARVLRVLDSKGANRSVYPGALFPEIQDMLLRRIASATGPYLFQGRFGGMRDPQSLTRRFAFSCDRTGLNDGITDRRLRVTFHTLRHTHATRMLEKGVDIYTLKQLMGHEDIATTERYLHLCDLTLREKAMVKSSPLNR